MMRRAKPILATAAIALSLAACQWMGGEEQAASRPTGSAGISGGDAPGTPAGQRYPSAQAQSVAPDFVQRVQQRLGDRGYDVGPVDGVWGESTQSALRNFQRDQGLQQSGQLDRQTLAALGIQPSGSQAQADRRQMQQQQQPMRQQQEPYRPTTQRGQQQGMMQQQQQQGMASQQQSVSPDIVRDIQQNLRDQGYDVGQVDGMWGPGTSRALSSFQRDQNLQATGRIDQQTLAALGLSQGQQTGQTPPERGTSLQERQRMEQDQLGETPPAGEEQDGLGLFEPEPEPDIGPAEQPQ